MKIKKRIVSLFSVIIVCIPLIFIFPFTASADTYNPPKDVDISKAGYRFGDLVTYLIDNYSVSESEYNALDGHSHIDATYTYQGTLYYFKINFNEDILALSIYNAIELADNVQPDEKVYFYSYYGKISGNVWNYVFLSRNFIYFNTSNSNNIFLESSTPIARFRSSSYSYKSYLKKCTATASFTKISNSTILNTSNDFYYRTNCSSYSCLYYSSEHIQFNNFINGSGLSGYPNFLINPDMSGYIDASDFFDKPLSEQIEVTLTPEFDYDMEGMDSSEQSNFFKFEIKNNSDSSIQWCAGIYDESTLQSMDLYHGSIWLYMCSETYFAFDSSEKKGFFKTTYNNWAIQKTGAFDFHVLKPHKSFSDVVYWENLNLSENIPYNFFVSAFKTTLEYPSANVQDSSYEYVPEISDSVSITINDSSLQDTLVIAPFDVYHVEPNIFDVRFSCCSMPSFTTTIRYGNALINNSLSDRNRNFQNYETKSNLDGSNLSINQNYIKPSILANSFNNDNLDINFNNYSIDDVKDYISSCQDFFTLIRDSLLCFPGFIWSLILFGLMGLIVIGIVKALL